MSLITIIVPCYNVEKFIEKQIVSFKNQNFTNFDVIFVDDCSTDDSVNIIKKLILKYNISAKVFSNVKNLGPSYTRKIGVSLSTSEYIAFCDSDDWLDANFLEEMYRATECGKHDIAFCNYKLVYDDGRFIEKKSVKKLRYYSSKEDFLVADMDGVCGGIFRRCLFNNFNFPNIRNGEDMAIIPILISKANSIGTTNACLYNYFQRKGSLSTTQTSVLIDDIKASFDYIYNNLPIDKYYSEIEYLGIRNLIYGSLLNLFKQKYDKDLANDICSCFKRRFPKWGNNKYFKKMPRYKKIYLFFARKKIFIGNYFLSKMHTILTK